MHIAGARRCVLYYNLVIQYLPAIYVGYVYIDDRRDPAG